MRDPSWSPGRNSSSPMTVTIERMKVRPSLCQVHGQLLFLYIFWANKQNHLDGCRQFCLPSSGLENKIYKNNRKV